MHKRVALIALTLAVASSTSILVAQNRTGTATPIKHLVILYPENRSFDHYFGTYPRALNLPGERHFQAKPHRPAINGLGDDLLFGNPKAVNPIRLGPTELVECSQSHAYTSEQLSANLGSMDKFVENDGAKGTQAGSLLCDPNMVMGYFDGNTVTALWNYAQHYALSDKQLRHHLGVFGCGGDQPRLGTDAWSVARP
jgi:phospholipase C